MRTGAKVYIGLVSLVGISLGLYSIWQYFFVEQIPISSPHAFTQFLVLAVITIVCRCLPLTVREGCALDMSFISILSAVLIQGPIAAAAIVFLTTPFVVVSVDGKKKTYRHIFNTAPEKTLFNISNLVISILAAGICYQLLGGVPGEMPVPESFLYAALFMVVSVVVNIIVLFTLFKMQGGFQFFPAIFMGLLQMVPNLICSTPIGYFFALLFLLPSGQYFALIFMLPLWLARYSFKLYLDGKKQQYSTVQTITAALEAKDAYTEGHSRRVEQYATLLAKELKFSHKQIEILQLAALFHDVGKIGVPDSILEKEGRLTEEEWKVIQKHPETGVHILENIYNYPGMRDIVLCHHERYDGKGYPQGLGGEEIPLAAYVLGVADAFDAITSDRPYRKGMSLEKAEQILREESGKQFHPKAAEGMIRLLQKGEIRLERTE